MISQTGELYLIATPIGNLNDLTLRAIEILQSLDLILCEDTRVSGKLLEHIKTLSNKEFIRPKLLAFHDHNEFKLLPQIIDFLKSGQKIGLISDAGTPLISDPGYKLVRSCLEQNIHVQALPGASSVLTALTLSGFPPDKFLFIGYLPRKSGQRKILIKNLNITPFAHTTIIAFESPYRLIASLQDLLETRGDLEVCVCRELTKMYEEVKRGKVSDVIAYFGKKSVKGEIVLLFQI